MIAGKIKSVSRPRLMIAVSAFLLTSSAARSQVDPAMRPPASFHVFSNLIYGSSNGAANHSEGVALGGFMQTTYRWGLELRGTYLNWGSNEARYDALAGGRVAFHAARFTPYVVGLAGLGHPVIRTAGPHSPYESDTGAEWKLVGGVDYYASHRLSFRLGEVSFAQVDALPKSRSWIDFGAGIAYRLHYRERER